MLRMVICDDEKTIAESIRREIQQVFQEHNVEIEIETYADPRSVLRRCKERKADFILLDINMPKMNGFELSKELKRLPDDKMPILLFMSAYDQFVFESFAYQPFEFLRKSRMKEELREKIERLIREHAYRSEQIELVRTEYACVMLRDVNYFVSSHNKLDACTNEGCYRCRGTISAMEEKYPNCLIRPHRSYLVNAEKIDKFYKDYILLLDGGRVPVSRSKRQTAEERYRKWVRKNG